MCLIDEIKLKLTFQVNRRVLIHFICSCVLLTEEQQRYEIFKNNMKIASHIQLYDLGTATYGASPFADLTGLRFEMCEECTAQFSVSGFCCLLCCYSAR